MKKALFAVLLLVGLSLATRAQAAPTVTAVSSVSKLAPGASGVLTFTVAVPTTDTVTYSNLSLTYTAPTPLTITAATGPKLLANQASLTYDGATAPILSNTVYVKISGQPLTVTTPTITIPVGTMPPGDSEPVTVTVKR